MPGKKRTAPSDGTSTAKDAKKPKKDGKDNKTGKKKEKAKATEKKTAQDNEAVPFVRRKGMKNGSKLATGKKYPGGHVSAAGNHVQHFRQLTRLFTLCLGPIRRRTYCSITIFIDNH